MWKDDYIPLAQQNKNGRPDLNFNMILNSNICSRCCLILSLNLGEIWNLSLSRPKVFAADHWLLRKSDFNPDSVLVRSVPDADKTGPSEVFVNQDLREDDGYIGTTVKQFDERADNSVEATEKADNTTLGDLAEDCAEDEWSCHLKGINRNFVVYIHLWNNHHKHMYITFFAMSLCYELCLLRYEFYISNGSTSSMNSYSYQLFRTEIWKVKQKFIWIQSIFTKCKVNR